MKSHRVSHLYECVKVVGQGCKATGDQVSNLYAATSIYFRLIIALHKCWSTVVRSFCFPKLGKSKWVTEEFQFYILFLKFAWNTVEPKLHTPVYFIQSVGFHFENFEEE